MDHDLPRQMADDPDVMISEHQLDRYAFLQKTGEKIKHDRAKSGRRSHDGVLRVPRDEDLVGLAGPKDPKELVRERGGRPFERAGRALPARPEAEMDVGNDQRPGGLRSVWLDDQGR